MSEHYVQLYESDLVIVDAVGKFISSALHVGEPAVVIATEPHRDGIEKWCRAHGLDLATASADGRFVSLDAAETLSRFMVGETPDPLRFEDVVGGLVERVSKPGRPARMFGEMVGLLAADGNQAATVYLEELWNTLQQSHSFALFCAYPMDCLGREEMGPLLGKVCAQHSAVIPTESYTALGTREERLRAIALLQQKAQSLEAEVSRRKRAEEQLEVALASEREARRAAEDALRLRDEFLSTAAHELRTPLTTIVGYAQMLLRQREREGQLDQERLVPALQAVGGQATKMSDLVSQLLDVSRLETGKLILQRQETDLAALAEEIIFGARARTERHNLNLEAPESLHAVVDPLRLDQVLTNLLDNAIKYSPNGGDIQVSLSQSDQDTVELSVRDHGLGIAPERRKQIFERFYQAHNTGYWSGLGLGLYISRQIVELHGGEICAEFPEDGGSRFIVRLPIGLVPSLSPDELADSGAGAGALATV